MTRYLLLFFLVSCGEAQNSNVVFRENLSSKVSVGTDSAEESLQFNNSSRKATNQTPFFNPPGRELLNQYVRFKRGQNNCSGVLSYEWESPNDIYLYTARHCFEKSDPVRGAQWDFDVVSNSKPLIDSASTFDNGVKRAFSVRSDNIEALSLNSQYIPSGFGKNRSQNAEQTDVVRIYQYSTPNYGKFEKICDSGSLVRAGFRGTLGYPDPSDKTSSPDGLVATVSQVEYDVLLTRLLKWLPGSNLQISSHLVKLSNSITLPGESGSPIFVATLADVRTNKYYFGCVDGLMTREITRLGQLGESYYNVMSFSGTSRSWTKVWSQKGFAKATQSTNVSPMTSPSSGSSSVQRLPGGNEVSLSLLDESSGEQIAATILPFQSDYVMECDKLVRSSYAKQSSNDFRCYANTTSVNYYEAPGYDPRFR